MKQSSVSQASFEKHPGATYDVHAAYIGLDVHKATIAISIAVDGRSEPEFRGEIPSEPRAIDKMICQLSQHFESQPLLFSYEAGPCGYGSITRFGPATMMVR